MTYKFCPHCATKNIFEIEPKFCCGCGKPMSAAVAEIEEDEEITDGIDHIKTPAKLDVEVHIPNESWEKFGANYGTDQSSYGRKARQENARPEFKKGEPIQEVIREDSRVQRKSIGGE